MTVAATVDGDGARRASALDAGTHSRRTRSICSSESSPASAISLMRRVMARSSDSPKVIPISRAR